MFTWRLLGRREYHQALEDSQDQIAIGMSMARELRAALSTSAAFEFVESTIAEHTNTHTHTHVRAYGQLPTDDPAAQQ